MLSFRKSILIAMISVSLLVVPVRQSQGFPIVVPIAVYLLEITGGSILVTDLIAGMTGTIAAVLWWECNKMQWGGQCENKPSSMPSAQAPGQGITINLKPDGKRSNPDSSRFDDSRESKPKSSVSATSSGGNTGQPSLTGSEAWCDYNGTGRCTVDNDIIGGTSSMAMDALGKLFVKRNWPTRTDISVSFHDCSLSGGSDQFYNCTMSLYVGGTLSNSTYGTFAVFKAAFNYSGYECPAAKIQGVCQNTEPFLTCPDGYTLGNGSCSLTDATKVLKPLSTKCEVLYYADTKSFKNDPQNPNCADVPEGSKVALSTNDGSGKSMLVQPNSNGGFDFTQDKGNGQVVTAHTGPYDAQSGGYPIISTDSSVPAGQTPDGKGDGCGIPGKPSCSVNFSVDDPTAAGGDLAKQGVSDGYNTLKGSLDNVDSNKFQWSFIPPIPVSACENPRVKNPLVAQYLDVDICRFFNKFSFFFNGILAVLCLYACAREVQKAMKA